MRTPARPGRNGSCAKLSSWLLRSRGQRLPKLVQTGTNSCLDGSERLIQPRRHFGIRQFGKKRGLDRLSLVRREGRQGTSQYPALLLELENIVGVTLSRRQWIARIRVNPLLPLFEAQPVD